MKKAIILLSGGLDSATVLAIAQSQNYQTYAISFDYGQRHKHELDAAKKIAAKAKVARHITIQCDMSEIGGSALTDHIDVPKHVAWEQIGKTVPVTYVPARNTIFLSFALGWSEVLKAYDIFIGVNSLDFSGYPDCRPEFIKSFEQTACIATGEQINIHAPLLYLNKAQIIRKGMELGVDYGHTITCYDYNQQGACGACEACILRLKGFQDAGYKDPVIYRLETIVPS